MGAFCIAVRNRVLHPGAPDPTPQRSAGMESSRNVLQSNKEKALACEGSAQILQEVISF
jgi:hypothetical protein